MMRHSIKRLARLCCAVVLPIAIVLVSSSTASAQFFPYGGMGAYGYGPGWGYGGFYGYPPMGLGYGGFGYGYGYPAWGYGYPAMGAGFYGTYGYPTYGYPGLYTPALSNPLFGVGLTPLGVQSYMYETQVLGRRSRR
jgi:hypothetical protein